MDDVVKENVILKIFPLFDIEQVEVNRCPKGTLFGRVANGFRAQTIQSRDVAFEGFPSVAEFEIINTDKGTGYGFEIDAQYLASDNLTLTAGYSYNHTKIQGESLTVIPCGANARFNFKGN